jgi:hypothetical protein
MLQPCLLLATRLRSDLENNPELCLPVPLEVSMTTNLKSDYWSNRKSSCDPAVAGLLILFLVGCFGFSPVAQALVPAPDGGYPGGNTAEGQAALLTLTSGANNTAVGWFSLRAVTESQLNTAIGAGTLFANTGSLNTATCRAFQQHDRFQQHGHRCPSSLSQQHRLQQRGQRFSSAL